MNDSRESDAREGGGVGDDEIAAHVIVLRVIRNAHYMPDAFKPSVDAAIAAMQAQQGAEPVDAKAIFMAGWDRCWDRFSVSTTDVEKDWIEYQRRAAEDAAEAATGAPR